MHHHDVYYLRESALVVVVEFSMSQEDRGLPIQIFTTCLTLFQYILLVFRDSSITSCALGCQPWPWGPSCLSVCFCGGFLCRGQLGPCSCGRGRLCPCLCFPAVAMWVRAISFHLHISQSSGCIFLLSHEARYTEGYQSGLDRCHEARYILCDISLDLIRIFR